MHPKMKVEFCITGTQVTPEEISRLIGISPSRTWNLGEPIQKTNLHRKHNGWCLSASIDNDDLDLEKPTKKILQTLMPKSTIIRSICGKFDLICELSYVAYIVDETPVINFNQDIISDVAELKATIDIDIILLGKDKNIA